MKFIQFSLKHEISLLIFLFNEINVKIKQKKKKLM